MTQSSIASKVLTDLYGKRAKMTNDISPFMVILEEAHNLVPSRSEGRKNSPSVAIIRRVITEGRKFGVGLLLITQRPLGLMKQR